MVNFEENLKKLEKIVDDLHGEKISLEKSLERFEDGVKIADQCLKAIDGMKKKIEVVAKSKDGKLKVKPFEEESEK